MKKINFVISTLILSDLLLFFGLGLLSPIFAVFVLEEIEGSSLAVVGTATTFYWLARVTAVIPISKYFDKVKGEKDEFYAVVFGTFVLALLPVLYIFVSKPHHIYLIEICKGIASSLVVPAWRILFTKFVDQKLIGFEWSFEDVCVGLATATSAFLGSRIAAAYGFKVVFILVGVIGFFAALFLTRLYSEQRIRRSKYPLFDFLKRNAPAQAPLKIDGIK